MDACLTKPFDSSSQSSEILDFYRAYQLQRLILIDKSKMCQQEPLPYQKMKELVDKSGNTILTLYSHNHEKEHSSL